jgi:hypothetical protein
MHEMARVARVGSPLLSRVARHRGSTRSRAAETPTRAAVPEHAHTHTRTHADGVVDRKARGGQTDEHGQSRRSQSTRWAGHRTLASFPQRQMRPARALSLSLSHRAAKEATVLSLSLARRPGWVGGARGTKERVEEAYSGEGATDRDPRREPISHVLLGHVREVAAIGAGSIRHSASRGESSGAASNETASSAHPERPLWGRICGEHVREQRGPASSEQAARGGHQGPRGRRRIRASGRRTHQSTCAGCVGRVKSSQVAPISPLV